MFSMRAICYIFNVYKGDLGLDGANKLADQFGGPQKLTLQMSTTPASDHGWNSSLPSWIPTGIGIHRSMLGTVKW